MAAKSFLLLSLMAGSALRAASAQEAAPLDPTVAEVTSGGHWTSEGRSGSFRIIVRSNGGPSDLTIEWLAAPTRSDGPTIVQSVAVKELSGLGRLDRPRIGQYLKGWRIWIQLTDNRTGPAKESSRSIDIGKPGELNILPAR